jgi:hypothetical protein
LGDRVISMDDRGGFPYLQLRTFPVQQDDGTSQGVVALGPPTQGMPLSHYCRAQILRHYMVLLDGRSRFKLSEPGRLTNLAMFPSNPLMAVYRDEQLYARLDAEILDAFGHHLVIDATQPATLIPGLSEEAPPRPRWQLSLDDDAIAYMAKATPLSEFSDGVQMYIGLIIALESLPHVLLLIDEPEAFLHPSLVRRLGSRLARIARERGANLLAATHSAEFLMGCIGEVPETDIVRLTYERGVATARPLVGAEVASLVKEPLLRSANALQALFARAAVICEADSDRAFYEEVNRRLLTTGSGTGDTIFLNAQNWQTVPKIAGPLRQLGIPAAMIMDLDTLAQDDKWPDHLRAAGIVGDHPIHRQRHEVKQLLATLKQADGDFVLKSKGLGAIPPDGRPAVERVIDQLREVGIFIVPVGELEQWLPGLGVTNKKTWVTEMLTRLGAEGTPYYIGPGPGDVWEFVDGIAAWLADPERAGMP